MKLLTLGATLSFTGSASQAVIALGGNPAVDIGGWNPATVSLGIAVLLALWGAYALAALGKLPPLPFMRPALFAIAAIYLARGMFLLPQFLGHNIFSSAYAVGAGDLVFSAAVLAAGAIYLAAARAPR